MNRHLLIKVTNMLHRVGPPIVDGKCRLRKLPRKSSLVNSSNEG